VPDPAGLPPPHKARLMVKSTGEVAVVKTLIDKEMLNLELPAGTHYFDIEHSASKKQKNSDKL
jgi:hypothetical protein